MVRDLKHWEVWGKGSGFFTLSGCVSWFYHLFHCLINEVPVDERGVRCVRPHTVRGHSLCMDHGVKEVCAKGNAEVKSLCVLGFAPLHVLRIFRPKCCSRSVPVWGVPDYGVIDSSELCVTGQDSILLVLLLKIHVRVRHYRIPSSLKCRKVFGEMREHVLSCLQLNSVLQQCKPSAPWGLVRASRIFCENFHCFS